MTTMQDKLQNVPDDLLALRLVELWTFFFGSVLPYLEGVFEPMASESEKSLRIDLGDSTPSSFVRDLSLAACRDHVLKPTLDRLERRLSTCNFLSSSQFFPLKKNIQF
jgi:hypothetical protein